jgi:hypothetical protein
VAGGDAACATSVDTASITINRPVVWDIHVANGEVPDTPAAQDIDTNWRKSMFVLDTDNTFIDGIDPTR